MEIYVGVLGKKRFKEFMFFDEVTRFDLKDAICPFSHPPVFVTTNAYIPIEIRYHRLFPRIS